MQKNSKIGIVAGLSLGAAFFVLAPQATVAHGKDKNVQNVTISVDGSGYHPATVNLKAGKPVHMTFISKGEGCANAVRIPALKKSIDLKKGRKKEITFTPKKGQTIVFACSMNMFKGRVVAK